MGKCQSCGRENVDTQTIWAGNRHMWVCAKCYAEIEKKLAQTKYYRK